VKTLSNPRDKDDLLRRLKRVRPDSARRWGRMTAHQMVCHLRDAFLIGTDPTQVRQVSGLHNRTIVNWIALYVPVRWPADLPTLPEIDQVSGGGITPTDFDADVAGLEAAVEALTANPDTFFRGRRHPIFGDMTRTAWFRWAYLHVDHHLRQFGA
jgi:hypothetical protein